jgi:mannose-6-phosphate isomerase-like protein (cupin superfamily)
MAAAAFLAIGTEGIVSRMYEIMRTGLRRAGIPDDELEFFAIHIACDDDHAITLENLMVSYAHRPGWFEACAAGLGRALDLRTRFFDGLFDALQSSRLEPMLRRMQGRESLARGLDDAAVCHRPGSETVAMYANQVERLNIQFTVERLPLAAEVLDPRMVRIPAGRFNEKHKHAHETLIHILEGAGQVVIDDRALPVRVGDTVLVPRWACTRPRTSGPPRCGSSRSPTSGSATGPTSAMRPITACTPTSTPGAAPIDKGLSWPCRRRTCAGRRARGGAPCRSGAPSR